jgi:hypothetical protein
MATMTWIASIREWRLLTPEQQRQIRLRRLPTKVARSMAFEGEPVDLRMLDAELARLTRPPDTSKPPSAS